MKAQIQQLLEQTVSSLKAAALIPVELEPRIQVDNTKDKAHGVTGGVYKARERIHRGMLIRDY